MFAYYYDLLMSDIDYQELITFLKEHIKKNDRVLDAGCGSGNILIPLVLHGYNVTGIDSDSDMLDIIRKKIRSLRITPRLINRDLLEPLDEQYDSILLMFDVINYFKDPMEVLKNLYHSLSVDGKLIFDMYQYDYLKEIDNYIEEEIEPIPYTFKTRVINNELHHEILVNNEAYKVIEYVFKLSDIKYILKTIGFQKIIVTRVFDERKEYVIAYK